MRNLRLLFVLFSLIVLAAPAGAQRRDRDHGRSKERGDETKRDRHERDDERDAKDDDEDDDDRNGQIGRDRRHERDDDEDDDRDDDDDDNGDRGGIGRRGCDDANGNNVCDLSGRTIPASLPEMVNAILISRGQLTPTGRNWLGATRFTPRFTRGANSTPRQVSWLDSNRRVRQVWLDTNRDGRADVVRLYRRGKLVRTVRR